ncbi:MAG: hydrogenase 4 subunit B [Alphaproteobacteria bacterium]|uniref:Hydrogenase 4 subunit B n=1 Tax=Candidatus Nitrobium versatile TaxID=2884831 RepID=A0A953J8J1_9BACT|nr:hydrogenase 4 subunit B [Candidatus Nitrobium versatile]
MIFSPLESALLSVLLFLVQAALVPFFRRNERLMITVCYGTAAIASLTAVAAGIGAVGGGATERAVLALGLPDLPFHLRLDPLSGFFLTTIGLLAFCVSVYSVGYVRGFLGHRPVARLIVFSSLFLAGMITVVLADDALIFLIAWELMAAASYFLVLYEDERPENRRAAFLYIVIAHIGAVAILLSFGVMAGLATGFRDFSGYSFDAMRAATFPAGWATAAFLLAFSGFAAKAGIVPLHVWLPEAHPVAPSNVSALMSGLMLKTAVYGVIRVTFDLIEIFPWWWGALVMMFGLLSAISGVLYALMQNDLKRLLAYSSIENVGLVFISIGLCMVFTSFRLPLIAALALTAGLYHALNHALFKGLLFMGAGSVLHATRERTMEEMGGLIHMMPWTAVLFLIGCISISALPPFNGFVSEWLTFQAFLLSPSLPAPLLKLLMPVGAALFALTAALSAACFVKAFGTTFLGHWRGRHKIRVHEADWTMKTGMIMTAAGCLLLGILPSLFIGWMDSVPVQIVGAPISVSAGTHGWLWLTPVAPERASYSGIIVFSGILVVVVSAYVLLHVRPGTLHRVPLWDCGFEKLTERMQYNGTSFSMPLRRIFGFLFNIKEQVRLTPQSAHSAFPRRLTYYLRVRDRFWGWLYRPVAGMSFRISRKVGKLQQGRIQAYLIYSFITIIVLLLFVK